MHHAFMLGGSATHPPALGARQETMKSTGEAPLKGIRVVEWSDGVAAAYAGRLLAALGAETILAERPEGSRLRKTAPLLPDSEVSALFSYLAIGKRSVVCDPETSKGRADLGRLLDDVDLFIIDLPLAERSALGLAEEQLVRSCPNLVYVSVLPFGSHGDKAEWKGEEINIIHAAGEGFLLPNGLSFDLFPDRPPLKIHGHFAEMQGGIAAALGALAALWCRGTTGGQSIDVSSQDAALAVGAFAMQRYGDGSLEHRSERSFKYGGVLECLDGHVELLTLEQRQWEGLVELMGGPQWALAPALDDSLERSRQGELINHHVRAWASREHTSDLVSRAQALGVPMARYNSPAEIIADPHEAARKLFQPVDIPDFGRVEALASPFHFGGAALTLDRGPPRLGQDQHLLDSGRAKAAMGVSVA